MYISSVSRARGVCVCGAVFGGAHRQSHIYICTFYIVSQYIFSSDGTRSQKLHSCKCLSGFRPCNPMIKTAPASLHLPTYSYLYINYLITYS